MPQSEGVFDKVKKTFLRMTSPFDNEASALDPLITMNYPPMTARRDAAYDRAVKLIRDNVFSKNEAERDVIYNAIIMLLGVAVDNTRIILAPSKKGMKVLEREPMLDYLKLLADTVGAARILVSHELMLSANEREMGAFLGAQAVQQFHSTDDIFSDSEMNIYHCVIELIDCAEPALMRYRDHRKRAFSKSDLERYSKAFTEFEILYNKAGRLQQPKTI